MPAPSRSFGVLLKVATILVGGRTSVNVPEASVENIETTDHDTADGNRTFIGGLIDNGTIPVSFNYIEADPGQQALIDGKGTTEPFLITLKSGATVAGSAIIGGVSMSNPIQGLITAQCNLRITGPVTITYAA